VNFALQNIQKKYEWNSPESATTHVYSTKCIPKWNILIQWDAQNISVCVTKCHLYCFFHHPRF